jgi:hypothetical protein
MDTQEKVSTSEEFVPEWNSIERERLVPTVEIPRALALDLVRCFDLAIILQETSEEDCKAGLHEKRFEAHAAHMDTLVEMVTSELISQGIDPDADNVLRALSIAYEAAALVGKHGIDVKEKVQALKALEVDGNLVEA